MESQEVLNQKVIKLKALLTIANEHIAILAKALAKQKADSHPGCCLRVTLLNEDRRCQDGRACDECNRFYLQEWTKAVIETYTVKVD